MEAMRTVMTNAPTRQLVAGARRRTGHGMPVGVASIGYSSWIHAADWATHKPFPRRLKEPPQ